MSANVIRMNPKLEPVSQSELRELTTLSLKLIDSLERFTKLYADVKAERQEMLERIAKGAEVVP